MKYRLPSLFVVSLSVSVSISTKAQQEYTLVTSAANIISAKALIDLPGLSGATGAIIIATPMGNTSTLNPHPIGAWYYSGKWNIFNSDYGAMIPGLTYKITYYLNPGSNQFLHLVTQQNLGAEGSYIDHPALNNKPNAQLTIFQNHAPDIRPGSWLNPHKASAGYSSSSGRWFIANISGQPIQKGCAYNVVISESGATTIINPGPVKTVTGATPDCKCPASLPPNGQASGDLTGSYPNPMVSKIMGRPVSNTPPQIGQILKWNGTEWAPVADDSGTGGGVNYSAGLGINITGNSINANTDAPLWNAGKILGIDVVTTAPTVGQVLKFGGGSWYPANDNVGASGSTPAYTAGTGITLIGTQIRALNNEPLWNAIQITNRNILPTEPSTGQVLKYNGTAWAPADDNTGTASTALPSQLFNNTYSFELTSSTLTTGAHIIYELAGLDRDITLTQTSKVLVSIHGSGYNVGCFACNDGVVEFRLFIDNKTAALDPGSSNYFQYLDASVPNGKGFSSDSGFRMITLGPGTHNFKLVVKHNSGGNVSIHPGNASPVGTRMMIIVIPQ